MTSPLGEKGMEAAEAAWHQTDMGLRWKLSDAIRAYLSAVALPDELPVWGYHVRRLTDEGAKFSQSLRFDQEQTSPTNVVTPLVSGPEAHSTIAALRADRDSWQRVAHRAEQVATDNATQIKRLAEDNEALRDERDNALSLVNYAEDAGTTLVARIKALEEALNLIDALDPEEHVYGTSHDACRGLIIRMGQIARAAINNTENADD